MNEITSIRSSYVRYKESTQKLVRWLVTNVASIPSVLREDNSQEHSQASPAKPKRKSGTRSKKGKKAADASTGLPGDPVISIRNFTEYATIIANQSNDVPIPEGVYSLFESVIHARRMVASFYRQLDTSPDVEAKNESHLNFIRVLEEAFDILGGSLWREKSAEEQEAARKAGKPVPQGKDEGSGTALHMSNRFAELEVEDRDLGVDEDEEEQPDSKESNEWISHLVNKPGTRVKKDKQGKPGKISLSSYKISEDLSAKEEISFAVWCFFIDMNSIRQYLKAIWNQVRKDNIDVVTAAVVTSVAVEMIMQLEANLQLSFPQLKDYPSLMRALLTELPIHKIKRVLELLDFCLFFPVHTVCGFRHRVFKQMPKMESRNLKEIAEIADQCGLNGRTFHTSVAQAEKIEDEADFLDQYLFKLMMATENADRTKPPDDPRLGMSAFHRDFEEFLHLGKLKTRLVFSIQLLLDIRNLLLPAHREKKLQFAHAVKYVRTQQGNLNREIKKIEERNGPVSLRKSLQMFVSHIDNWIEFGKFQPSGEWSTITFPDMRKNFLSENPWHLGLVYAEVSVQLFAMASYHSSISLPSMLHLYNFLLHVESVVPGVENLKPIPLLELLCEAFGKHVFQGARPAKNFSARFAVSARKEISTFASDAHRRVRTVTPTSKQLERLTLPSIMSTLHAVVADHYKLHGQAYSWIEKAVEASTGSEGVPPRKGNRTTGALNSLSPAQLLDRICQALWVDFNGSVPIGRVDMLRIRELSYRVRGSVYNKIRGHFTTRAGQRNPLTLKDGPEFDLTHSILEIERYAHNRGVQRKIINGTKEVFADTFESIKMEKYFAKMPYSRTKGWKDRVLGGADEDKKGKSKKEEVKEGREKGKEQETEEMGIVDIEEHDKAE
ncbi:hypothetical protein EV426DRAFT_89441 [Tirmania nivea]|nr:hypothetical protein EV426DRAFT_89441 [Tirmania nivea]